MSNLKKNFTINDKLPPLLLLPDSGSTVVLEKTLNIYYNYHRDTERKLGEIITALKCLGSFMLDLFMIYFLCKTQSLYVAYASLFLHMIQKRNLDGVIMVER